MQLREEARINHRREQLELRKQRIHGSNRSNGLEDLQFINQQVEEKRKKKEQEQEIADLESKFMLSSSRVKSIGGGTWL